MSFRILDCFSFYVKGYNILYCLSIRMKKKDFIEIKHSNVNVDFNGRTSENDFNSTFLLNWKQNITIIFPKTTFSVSSRAYYLNKFKYKRYLYQ